MSLALLVPMRQQPIRRELFLYSLTRTLGTTPIHLIVRVDDDDPETLQWLTSRTRHLDVSILVGPRFEGYKSLPRFFNELVRLVRPGTTAIMCGNDDQIFETPDWAGDLCRASRRYRTFFNLGGLTYPPGVFPWSCVSPKFVDAMGGLCRVELCYSDIYLRDVHARLGCCELVPSVVIQHIGNADADAQAYKAGLPADYWHRHAHCVNDAVETLRPLMTRRVFGWRGWQTVAA